MRNHIVSGIVELAEKDSRIVLITADLGFGVLETFRDCFPDRYINCGIAEQNMAAVAAGVALEGDIVFMYSIGNFPTLRCIEQIRNDICYHNANVKILAVGGGFSYGSLGMTHHATEDLSIMRALPNMRVYAPADPGEAAEVLREIYRVDGPCYVRLARGGDPVLHTPMPGVKPLRLASEGNIAILSTGTILSEAKRAAEMLREQGVQVGLYSCPCVKPLDQEAIIAIAQQHRQIITVEENQITGGFGSAVMEMLAENGVCTCVKRIGLRDTYTNVVGSQDYLRMWYGMDSNAIVETVLEGVKQ